MHIIHKDEISQLSEKIFPWIADPEKAMKWQKNVKGGAIIKKEPQVVGTTFTEEIEEDGKKLEMYGAITKYEKNRILGFHIESKIHKFDVSYTLEKAGELTNLIIEVAIDWKFPMNIISFFMHNKIEENLRTQLKSEVQELKKLCVD